MSGLRERQKQERRALIAGAALAEFKSNGFAATTVENIANAAGVSPPTVVNYFGSKQGVLLALLQEPDHRSIEESSLRVRDFTNPVDALCDLEMTVTGNQVKSMPASLWREIIPIWLNGDAPEVFRAWNDAVVAGAQVLLKHFCANGVLRKDLDVELVARMINDWANIAFVRLAAQDEPDMAAHGEYMRKVFTVLCEGIAR
ncbi:MULTISPECIES: TetR/AcrR family transcriptional regulator [unclassified Paraburkholderia]|uniref:TetR/AcrR family transcriptional regulator n=1 Tax=unclassified Paraburkholderia TaxID=2615204 RepID=UPI002AAFB07C|nr:MULTISPECIES: TetR/AcrR family transcriptional regulator [unclassified Paraburkholderia]